MYGCLVAIYVIIMLLEYWWLHWRDYAGIWGGWDIQWDPLCANSRSWRVCTHLHYTLTMFQPQPGLTYMYRSPPRYGYSHGSFNEVCMRIPALFMGPQVKKGYQISSYTTDKDFAPTALNALGLRPGQYMVGRVVDDIYQWYIVKYNTVMAIHASYICFIYYLTGNQMWTDL